MNAELQQIARHCLEGAERNAITFPQIVGLLADAGFDNYLVDYRRDLATYYHRDSDSITLPTHASEVPIPPAFDTAAIQSAIRDAQAQVPGYTYLGFCERVRAAGCAGYMVSIIGRRALYFGRTAETHVELFPTPA